MFIKNNNCGSSEQERIRVCCDNDGNILSVNLLEKVELTFEELQSRFTEVESNNKPHLTGYITFTADSFSEEYSEIARTYKFSSDNKLFNGKFSISLFGSCLDGTDIGVRLDQYMSKFHGGPDGWKVENCYYYKNKEL